LQAAPAPIHPTKPRLLSRKSTALTTKPPGGGEEAHRRWPEGRSERGASKAKHRPPVVFRKALPRLRISKIMDSKIILSGACATGSSSGLVSSAV